MTQPEQLLSGWLLRIKLATMDIPVFELLGRIECSRNVSRATAREMIWTIDGCLETAQVIFYRNDGRIELWDIAAPDGACTCGESHIQTPSQRIVHRYDGKPCYVADC